MRCTVRTGFVLSLFALAACGGGGDGGSAAVVTPGTAATSTAVVPGYTVDAHATPTSDGWRVRATIAPAPGVSPITAVALRLGDAYDPTAATVAATTATDGWEAVVPAPSPGSPVTRVVVVATAADGSRIETGPDQLLLP